VETFNGKFRDELLARELFDTLLEAQVLIERWRRTYNTVRLNSALGRSLARATPTMETCSTHGGTSFSCCPLLEFAVW
jgi:transposase InsO family protein